MPEYSEIQAQLWPDDAPTDPTEVTEGYNKIAATYAAQSFADGWMVTFDKCMAELDKQLPLKKGPIKLLDAGCGDGLLPELYDFAPYDITLYGIDGSREMLAMSESKGKYKELKLTNVMERFPYGDNEFDVIVANGLMGYLENSSPMHEFMRVLKKNGHFVFTMRVTHYNDRGWAKCVADKVGQWKVLRADPFDPFPKNPGYTHTYHCVCITKLE